MLMELWPPLPWHMVGQVRREGKWAYKASVAEWLSNCIPGKSGASSNYPMLCRSATLVYIYICFLNLPSMVHFPCNLLSQLEVLSVFQHTPAGPKVSNTTQDAWASVSPDRSMQLKYASRALATHRGFGNSQSHQR